MSMLQIVMQDDHGRPLGPVSFDQALGWARSSAMVAALEYFRRALGDNWNGWVVQRPLASEFWTGFQGGPPEGVRLHGLALQLDDGTELRSLLRRSLGSPNWEDYVSGVTTLEVCARLRAAGRSVSLVPTANQASPDLIVALDTRPVTIELKALHRSPAALANRALMEDVIGRVAFADPSIYDLAVRPGLLAFERRDEFTDGLVAVARGDDEEWHDLPVQTGAARRAPPHERGWWFTRPQRADAERLLVNFRTKWRKQLRSRRTPTALIVRGQFFFPPEDQLPRVFELADQLRAALAHRPEVGAIVAYEDWLWAPPPPMSTSFGDAIFSLDAPDGHARATLLVRNPRASLPLSDGEIAILGGSARSW